MAPGRGIKQTNAYSRIASSIDAPKSVWQAIAYSLAIRVTGSGDDSSAVLRFLRMEWGLLHAEKIVPQRPKQ